jgi:hypothetical protein
MLDSADGRVDEQHGCCPGQSDRAGLSLVAAFYAIERGKVRACTFPRLSGPIDFERYKASFMNCPASRTLPAPTMPRLSSRRSSFSYKTKYNSLGAKTARGAYLSAAPGTGTTLLARAVVGRPGCRSFPAPRRSKMQFD